MEVPEFCKRASTRLAKKRKTEEETDPDYQPIIETERKSTSRRRSTRGATTPSNSDSLVAAVIADSSKSPEIGTSGMLNSPEVGTSGTFSTPSATADKVNFRGERKKVRRSKAIVEELRKPTPGLQFIDRNDYSIEDWKEKASKVRRNRILGTAKEMADCLVDVDNDRLAGHEYPVQQIKHFGSENPYSRYVEPGDADGVELDEYDFDYNDLPPYVMGTGKGTKGGPPTWEFKTLWNYELTPFELDDPLDESLLPWEQTDVTEPDMKPDILSIVASFTVGCVLNLKEIAHGSRNIEYNPDRFAPLIMRVRQPKSTALIFASGRIIVAGTRSEDECRQACRKYVRIINKFGHRGAVLSFEIQNISASCSLKFRVRLNRLCENKLLGPLSYEPEMFPGLVIPLEFPKIKIIIFQTGSVLMTGGKSEADVQLAFRKIYPMVRMYAP